MDPLRENNIVALQQRRDASHAPPKQTHRWSERGGTRRATPSCSKSRAPTSQAQHRRRRLRNGAIVETTSATTIPKSHSKKKRTRLRTSQPWQAERPRQRCSVWRPRPPHQRGVPTAARQHACRCRPPQCDKRRIPLEPHRAPTCPTSLPSPPRRSSSPHGAPQPRCRNAAAGEGAMPT